jgi:hypothetical protein
MVVIIPMSFKTFFQVTWVSYESSEIMGLQESHGLNSFCYVVECHLHTRVMRKFGREQPISPDCPSTSVELHR